MAMAAERMAMAADRVAADRVAKAVRVLVMRAAGG